MDPINPFVSNTITFTRELAILVLYSSGEEQESGGHWKCGVCRMLVAIESSPRQHAEILHSLPAGYRVVAAE